MKLWDTRKQSEHWLKNELAHEWKEILLGFQLIDTAISKFNDVSSSSNDLLLAKFARVCGLIGTKARILLHCNLSLTLDAHAQESGAILRPLIEAIEFLNYMCLDPQKADDFVEGTKPKAGKIAKAIQSGFHGLRNHLNDNASHLGIGDHALNHLIDQDSLLLKPKQTHDLHTLGTNLCITNAFQFFTAFELLNCLIAIGVNVTQVEGEIEDWRKGFQITFAKYNPVNPSQDA